MLCQSCSKNTATTYVKTIINGVLTESALCPECAKKLGYTDIFSNFEFNFGSILGNNSNKKENKEVECSFCGSTFESIAKSGKIGCANCYKVFYDRLIPSIQRIHGNTKHSGKRPGSAALILHPRAQLSSAAMKIQEKQNELEKAIKEQNFEYAAVLRDEITALKLGEENANE